MNEERTKWRKRLLNKGVGERTERERKGRRVGEHSKNDTLTNTHTDKHKVLEAHLFQTSAGQSCDKRED